ncbi:MAG TPA: MFS transporter [Longimicrobiales bacterium]|nr:MFS transporter [Longimicrobiales bacterium]
MNTAGAAPRDSDLPPNARIILFALWLMVFSSGSQVMLISPIFPRIREQLGIADAALGTLISVDAIMLGLVALIAGPISDRIGRRRILLIGCAGMTIALALHALAFDYVSLLLVRALAGSAGGILSGAAVAYVGDYFPYQRRGWANGWVMTGFAFGHIIGIPAGAVLAAQFGFRVPYLLFSATTALTFVLVLRHVPQPAMSHAVRPLTIRGAVNGYVELLRNAAVLAAVVTFAITFLGNSLFVIYLPTWLEDSVGVSPGQVAAIFFTGGVANVLTGPRAGRLSDRIGRKRVIITATIGLGLLILAVTFITRNVFMAFVVFAGVMTLFSARVGPIQALLTQLVPGERRGSLMSLAVGIGQLGFALGGALAGFVYANFGFRSSTALAAMFLLSTAWIVARFLPEPLAHAHTHVTAETGFGEPAA